MRALVTGGAGFIGSHLVERLLADGHEVRVLDDFSTGKHVNLRACAAQIDLVEGSVAEPRTAEACLDGIDAVFHLAAVASVEASIQDPIGTHRTNAIGTLVLLEAMKRAGVPRLIYASSASVYGDLASLPAHEDALPAPLSPYAVDKLAGEHYVRAYAGMTGMRALSFRFFNVFGPRQDPASPYAGVIGVFAHRVAAGEPVRLDGDGLQTRDFVFVGDVVDVLARSVHGDSGGVHVVNLGTGVERSLLELLETLEAVLGRGVERVSAPARPGDVRRSAASDERLTRLFGPLTWTPFQDGLRATLDAMSNGRSDRLP